MDVSAFEAVSEEDPLSMSEVAALFDEDLRLPVEGAIAIARHLLRLALLVWTLAACVFLCFFALAWLCLFWAQTRLFKYTTALLNRCMSATPATTCSKINRRLTHEAKANGTSQTSSAERPPDTISGSGLAAETGRSAHLQERLTPIHLITSTKDTYGSIDADKSVILQEILQREKDLEREIQELVTSRGTELGCIQPTSPIKIASSAEGFSLDWRGHAADGNDGEVVEGNHRQGSLSGSEFNGDPLVGDTTTTDCSQQSELLNRHTSNDHVDAKPVQTATFKLAKPKVNKKPRVDYAEQAKERKAREQTSFVNTLTTNRIVSAKKDERKSRVTQAEHVQSLWNGESEVTPTRSRPLTAITKPSLSQASLHPIPISKQPTRNPTGQVVKPVHRNDRHSLNIPPHMRDTVDAKATHPTVDHLTCESNVEEKAKEPTDNPFASLSDDISSIDVQNSLQVKYEDVVQLEKSATSKISSGESPSTPDYIRQPSTPTPVEQIPLREETSLHEFLSTAQLEHGVKHAGAVDKRRVYTVDALKAAKDATIEIHQNAIAGKIEAAAELVAFHTHSGQASRSPRKKLAVSRWDTFDGIKKHPPASDRITRPFSAAENSETVSQPPHASSPALQDRQDRHVCVRSPSRYLLTQCSAISISNITNLVENSVDIFTELALVAKVTTQAALSDSSNLDLAGLEFRNPSSFDQPVPNSIPLENFRSLPITPGPLAFFAPKVEAVEKPTSKCSFSPEGRPHHEPFAFNLFVPGLFQSHGYQNDQIPQHFQPQEIQWAEPGGHESQDHFSMPQQMSPYMSLYNPMAPTFANNDPGVINDRLQSLAVPIRVPSSNLPSEEVFPALGAPESVQNEVSVPGPPSLSAARPDTQATFDSLLSTSEARPERSLNLGKFISTATTSSARLNRTHGQAVSETGSAVKATSTHDNRPSTALVNLPAITDTPTTGYEATFPELPTVIVSAVQIGGESSDKNVKREKRKLARDSLKYTWHDREESRKNLVGSFSLEGANELKQNTLLYLEKRSALQSLMSSGALNQQDTAMFPEFGLMDLSPPKMKALGVEEWRSRKRETKAASAKVANGAPVTPAERTDDIDPIIKDLIIAVRHREQSGDLLKMPRPQSNMSYSTWVTTCKQTCARADKLYIRKRKILVEAYPSGLPTELEMRFPDISLKG